MTSEIEPIADAPHVAAARLGICKAELYKQIAAGRIQARKVGRRTIISREQQSLWLAALPLKAVAA